MGLTPGSNGFWRFDQFNDLNVADGKGRQLWSDVGTLKQELGEKPEQMILFQRAGSEHTNRTPTGFGLIDPSRTNRTVTSIGARQRRPRALA